MEIDNYAVKCVRDDTGAEEFVIRFMNLAEGKIKRMTGPFTEAEVRTEMEKMGTLPANIDDNIRLAREHAEQKS